MDLMNIVPRGQNTRKLIRVLPFMSLHPQDNMVQPVIFQDSLIENNMEKQKQLKIKKQLYKKFKMWLKTKKLKTASTEIFKKI